MSICKIRQYVTVLAKLRIRKACKTVFFSVWNYHDSVVSFLQCLSKPMQERGHFCLSLLAHTGPVTSVGFGTPFAITDTER